MRISEPGKGAHFRALLLWGVSAAAIATSCVQASAQSNGAIETVVVTAERRSESLQNVPAAVSVVTGDELENLGVTDTKSLLQMIPGVSLVPSGPSFLQDISMRGQGAGRNGFSETSTGIYENGAYIAGGGFNGRELTELNLFDIERIEVLHGPQGALYGRNAVGGAIDVIVKQPDDEFGLKGKLQYGSQDYYRAEAVINAPVDLLGVKFDTRLGGFYSERDSGFILNDTTGHHVDGMRTGGGRLGISAAPWANGKLYLQLEYYDVVQPSFGTAGYVPVYAATTSDFIKGAVLDPGPYEHAQMNREGKSYAPDLTGYVGLDQDTGPGLLSVKLYTRNRDASRTNEDYDHFLGLSTFAPRGTGGVNIPVDLAQDQFEKFHLYDGQATLASHDGERLSWIAGFEALHYSDEVSQGFENCAAYNPAAKTSAQMITYLQNGTGGCVTGVVPVAAAYTPASLATTDTTILQVIRGQLNHIAYTNLITSYAWFAKVSYDILPDLTAGAEMRYSEDENSYNFAQYSQDPLSYWGAGAVPSGFAKPIAGEYCPPSVVAAGLCTGTATGPYASGKQATRWDEVLPGATLTYKPETDETFYARYATGYRPGGFNNPLTAVQPLFKPEYTQSFELGWKGSLFGFADGNADVYYQKTSNVQLVQFSQTAAGGFVLQNVGKDYVRGAEANLSRDFGDIGPGDLKLSLGLSTNYGTFLSPTTITEKAPFGPISIAGLRVPFTSDIQGSLGTAYTIPVHAGYRLVLETDYQFASAGPQQYTAANGVLSTFDSATRNQIDVHVSLISSDAWILSAFGKNVTDQKYRVSNVSGAQYWSQPATWGISLTAMQ
jgi:iron complex outermembrane receptor protein